MTSCDSIYWNESTYTESGNYSFTTLNSLGCDSVAYLTLTINNSDTIIDNQEHCNEYTWIDGITYTENNNNALFVYSNSYGCDSVIQLNLIINQSTTSETNVTNCNSYFWNGITYTESGTYYFYTNNSKGCDSTAILNLEIIQALSSSLTEVTTCNEEYTWNDNTYYESGLYMIVLPGLTGCDSISSLLLTINTPSTSEEYVTVCDEYLWNGQLYTESGTYEFATNDQNGCDSLAIIELDICKASEIYINGPENVITESTSSYIVESNTNSAYNWFISGLGTINSGQGSNSIEIQWSNIEGISTLCVVEKVDCASEISCFGDTTCFEILVQKPTIIIEQFDDNFQIYPHPITDKSKVEFSRLNSEEVYINILDYRGRIVRSYGKVEGNQLIVKKNGLTAGIYFIEINSNSKIRRSKIIFQ